MKARWWAAAALVALLGGWFVTWKLEDAAFRAGERSREHELASVSSLISLRRRQEALAVRARVLVYHHIASVRSLAASSQKDFDVEPADFRRQLAYLRGHGYAFITLTALIDHLTDGTPLPKKPVVITFDDGLESQYRQALPIIEDYGVPATFFIVTDDIGTKDHMTWAQLRDLAARGHILAAHTKTHPWLTTIGDGAQLHDEIAGSKAALEKGLGRTAEFFAYPHGQYNDRVVAEVKKAGFRAARGTWWGTEYSAGDLYGLKAILVPHDLKDFPAAIGDGTP